MARLFERESHRKKKVERLLQQEISRIIIHEISDPRRAFCTVTKVRLSGDMKVANVHVSIYASEAGQRATIRALRHAAGYIKGQLSNHVPLKYIPALAFHMDDSIERSMRISRILREEGVADTPEPDAQEGPVGEPAREEERSDPGPVTE
jgi:ribosome-binding factor A